MEYESFDTEIHYYATRVYTVKNVIIFTICLLYNVVYKIKNWA